MYKDLHFTVERPLSMYNHHKKKLPKENVLTPKYSLKNLFIYLFILFLWKPRLKISFG